MQSPVNRFVSLRKEFLSSDKQKINRINTHQTGEQTALRQAVVAEQENSELYQFLRTPMQFEAQLTALSDETNKLAKSSEAHKLAINLHKDLHNANALYHRNNNRKAFTENVERIINTARNSELNNYPTFKKILINIGLCIAALCVGGVGLIAFLGYRAYQNKMEQTRHHHNTSHFWYVPRSAVIKQAEVLRETAHKIAPTN